MHIIMYVERVLSCGNYSILTVKSSECDSSGWRTNSSRSVQPKLIVFFFYKVTIFCIWKSLSFSFLSCGKRRVKWAPHTLLLFPFRRGWFIIYFVKLVAVMPRTVKFLSLSKWQKLYCTNNIMYFSSREATQMNQKVTKLSQAGQIYLYQSNKSNPI